MPYAPIALFTYNRADHTRQAVESLLGNEEAKHSDLFIFSDGPKNELKAQGVKENREYIKTVGGFKSVTIIEREKNWGLANSLIAGITEIVNKYGRVIVVEDDLMLSPYFLKFMNDALEKYENDDRVGAVSAYMPVIKEKLPDTFFLRYFHCWGWATWKRSWSLLNRDTNDLLKQIRWKTRKFNLDGVMANYGMLYCQKKGLVDSWFILFYASLYLAEKLVLFPGQSLVRNIGLDKSGVHSSLSKETVQKEHCNVYPCDRPLDIETIEVSENEKAYIAYCDVFRKRNSIIGYVNALKSRMKSFVRRLLGVDLR